MNELLVPAGLGLDPGPVAVIVKPVFVVFVIVTFCVRTPFKNAFDVSGAPDSAPVEVRVTLLLKLVTVLLPASKAVMVMLKAVPAVCGLEMVAKLK